MQVLESKASGFISLLTIQLFIFIFFIFYVRYENEYSVQRKSFKSQGEENVSKYYPHFQDIHTMIFVGFGFLMTFLKRYGYSALGFTLFLGALSIQLSLIIKGFFRMRNGFMRIGLKNIIEADIATAVPLISMGALLGRTTPLQLFCMLAIEIVIFAVNEFIQLELLKISDVGGSITVHALGAYFGLAVNCVLRSKNTENQISKHEESSYTSDMFAMIGTMFLWIFWPSFNSVFVDGNEREIVIMNTYLSLTAATVISFLISALVHPKRKFNMVHVQNSTLAGGVGIGSVCNLVLNPYGAILIGIISGIVSVLGYRFLSPFITMKFRIHDTCGVHNLHGMPAIVSAIASAIYASLANEDIYKDIDTLQHLFPAMVCKHKNETGSVFLECERSSLEQGGYQLLGIISTLVIAGISGCLTGMLLRSPNLRKITTEYLHDDEASWEVAEE